MKTKNEMNDDENVRFVEFWFDSKNNKLLIANIYN